MKLTRLELRAFGHFTDHPLDFGDGSGLHLLFGENESGKTTILDAITYTLFGMPTGKSDLPKYGFQHNLPNLRVALRMVLDDGSGIAFARKRSTSKEGTVRDFESDDADEALRTKIESTLSGVPAEAFKNRHGINQHTLRAGTQALIATGGQAGEALYAVATGMHEARGVLDVIRAQRQAILSDAGNKGSLHEAARDLKAADAAFKKAKRAAGAYDTKVGQRDRLRSEVDAVSARHTEASESATRLAKIVASFPVLEQRAALIEQRDAIQPLADDWDHGDHDGLAESQRTQRAAAGAIKSIEKAVAVAEAKIATLQVDESLIASEDSVGALHQRLDTYRTARDQHPDAKAAAVSARAALESAITSVTGTDTVAPDEAAKLLPSAALRTRIESGITSCLSAVTAVAKAKLDLQEAEQRYNDAKSAHAENDPYDDAAHERLVAALDAARGFAASERDKLETKVSALQKRLETESAALPGCALNLEAVRSCPLPAAASITDLVNRMRQVNEAINDARTIEQQALAKITEREAKLQLLEAEGEVPDANHLASLRLGRDTKWSAIKEIFTGKSTTESAGTLAAEYELDVAGADSYADDIARNQERVGKASELRADLNADNERVATAREAMAKCETERTQTTGDWAELWKPAGISATTPDAMSELTTQIASIRKDALQLDEERAQLAALDTRSGELAQDLQAALAEASGDATVRPSGLATLIEQARNLVTARDEARKQRNEADVKLEAARRNVESTTKSLSRAMEAETEADAAWNETCTAAALDMGTTPEAAQAYLDATDNLRTSIDAHTRASNALGALDETIRAFESDVAAVRDATANRDSTDSTEPADMCIVRLVKLVAKAAKAESVRDTTREHIEELQDGLVEHVEKLEAANQTATELQAKAGAKDMSELETLDRNWARYSELESQIVALDTKLLEATGLSTTRIVEEIAGRSSTEIAVALDKLKRDAQEHKQESDTRRTELEELIGEIGAIERSNEQAAARQQMQDKTAALERLVPEYRHLWIQERILATALGSQAARDMTRILELTGEYFQRLTCGDYSGLGVDFNDAGEPVFHCKRVRDNLNIAVGDLSEGAEDQLYLSLRLATIIVELDEGTRESMPFIVDDILPSFDNPRAAATMELLGEVAERTQVIFLTHLEHHIGLAEEHVSDDVLTVHRLGRVAVGA